MSIVSYKCPNCGGDLVFDPASGQYKCEYCISLFSQEELEALNPSGSEDKESGISREQPDGDPDGLSGKGCRDEKDDGIPGEDASGAMLYTCPSCGAQIVTDETTAASFCFYCHNPVILSGRLEGGFKPDKIIPFAFDRSEATRRFQDFIKSKKFVPNAFFNKKQIEKLSGVYFPYWVYDGQLSARVSGEGRKVRVWVAGDVEYTETKVYHVEREGDVYINDLTKNALKKADSLLSNGVLPYDFSRAEEFHMGYLSGFLAEKRDIEQLDLRTEVEQEVNRYAEMLLDRETHEYSVLSGKRCQTRPTDERWSYVLLPVWTVTYKGSNGKIYYYSMNGQTGKTFGELPVDLKRVFLVGLIIGICVLVCFLIGGYIV